MLVNLWFYKDGEKVKAVYENVDTTEVVSGEFRIIKNNGEKDTHEMENVKQINHFESQTFPLFAKGETLAD